MKIKHLLCAATLCAAGLTACQSDPDNSAVNPLVDDGDPAQISLAISQPKTYEQDDTATTDEVDFKSADVFIYKGNTLVVHERLDYPTDFETPASGQNRYVASKKITTTTGTKEVYVGVNLPTAMRDAIVAAGNKSGLTTAQTWKTSQLTDPKTGFAMFSTKGVNGTFVPVGDPNEDPDNIVEVQVERMVAKVTVEKSSSLNLAVTGGKLDDLSFGIRNKNTRIFPWKQTIGGVVMDPNFDTYNGSDFEHDEITDYVAVNSYMNDVKGLNPMYALENTSLNHQTRETTYASLRALFIPTTLTNADGSPVDNSSSTGGSFWVVTNKTTFAVNYFDTEDKAKTFASTNNGVVSEEYIGGYCYYNMFLNPDGQYNTIRNDYYRTSIRSISGLGNPNPWDEGNTTEPVAEPAQIIIDIDILKWNLIDAHYDL